MTARSTLHLLRRMRGPVFLGVLAVAVVASVILALDLPETSSSSLTTARAQEEPTEGTTDVPEVGETEGETFTTEVSTYEVFLARDPFEPVIPEPASGDGDGSGDGVDVDVDVDTGDGQSPVTSPTTAPTVGPTTGPTSPSPTTSPTSSPDDGRCVTNATVTCDGHEVSLVDVFVEDGTPVAAVRVDDTVYEVRVGDRFAEHFEVLSIEPPNEATLRFGDDSFTLFEGESVLK